MKQIALFFGGVCLAFCVSGCGGHADLTGIGGGKPADTGRLTMTIKWPAQTRVIPSGANSVSVTLSSSNGAFHVTKSSPRPSGLNQSTLSFDGLPVGLLDIEDDSYASTDGSGVALSRGKGTIQINPTGIAKVTVDMSLKFDFVWVSDQSGSQQIWGAMKDGSQATQLTTSVAGGARIGPYGLSQDGWKVVFASPGANTGEIWVLDIPSRMLTQLTTDGGTNDNSVPSWSPDGTHIVFRKRLNQSQDYEIYTMNADGSNVQALTSGFAPSDAPCYSADGKRVAFASANTRGVPDIIIQDAVGLNSHQVNLTSSLGGANTSPSFSANGQKLCFIHASINNQGVGDVWTMNLDGSSQTQLTNSASGSPGATGRGTSWSPDGSQIFFAAIPSANIENIFSVNVQTKAITQITHGSSYDTYAAFSF